MTRPPRPRRHNFQRLCLAAAVVFCAAMDFGLTGDDDGRLRAFTTAVVRWQVDPEFRTVAKEYCVLGSGAMQARPFLLPARRLIIAIRSVPGLPKEFAVNPTSRQHYEDFTRGPLSAYLHLCGEQDVPIYLAALEPLGQNTGRTDADLRAWLDARRMDFPLAKDAGARRSVESLLADTDAGRPFEVRDNVEARLGPHIAAVADEVGVPRTPAAMTSDQQHTVLDRLDGYVRQHDPELWRTKQVSDFAGGVWAQVFGPPYNELLVPFVVAHTVCRIALVLLLAAVAWRLARSLRTRAARPVIDDSASDSSVAPATSPPAERPNETAGAIA